MSKPARQGVIIYSNNTEDLAAFYESVFAMDIIKTSKQWVTLECEGLHIVVHVPPQQFPPERMNTIKLFISVDSHHDAHQSVTEAGGKSLPGEWANPLFSVSNIADPEGNIVQLRVFAASE
ncbi:VOC family protein [Salinimonas chungwhensis]|uniref:glyoxalase/bleomycin resistance/dioxygenase family protein n=1 Tax=Salinimonas chungwhensis TaxID=265425 RepID=UPI0003742723|nr:glyoxalase/bleomycin resistance/dioxygenase family protein [Salinimonas chungwhensis]